MSEVKNSVVSGVPKEWSGAFGLFKYSRAAVAVNVWVIIGLIVLGIVLQGVVVLVFGRDLGLPADQIQPPSTGESIVSAIVGSLLTIAAISTLLAGIDQKEQDFADALRTAFPLLWLKVIGQSIVLSFLIALSIIALVIPFFFVMPRLALAQSILIDKNCGILESIRLSWEMTRGHSGKVYGIIGVELLFVIIMATVIGIPVAIFLLVAYAAALPLLYRHLDTKTV